MNSFRDFVVGGAIGQIRLAISGPEVLQLLGPPADWLGKATIVGEPCPNYERSRLWLYYEGSVGVRFDETAKAVEIVLYPEHLSKCPQLFGGWSIAERPTMGRWRQALVENVVPFRESNPESLNYWIVADETCVAFGFPGPEGSKRGHERSVDILAKYRDPRTMLDECK